MIQSDFLPLLDAFHELLLATCRPPRVRIGSSSQPHAHYPGARSMRAGEGLGWARVSWAYSPAPHHSSHTLPTAAVLLGPHCVDLVKSGVKKEPSGEAGEHLPRRLQDI